MAWKPHAVALTGGTGMSGRHIAAALDRAGSACALVNRTQWDIRQWATDDTLDRLFGAADAIVHAAAAVPAPGVPVAAQELLDANVRSCLCLGDWSRRRGKPVVFLSGATVYASLGKAGIAETDAITTRPPSGLYGLSKLLAEQVLDGLAGEGLRVCCLRPSSIYGAGMSESRMVASMLAKARRKEDIRLQPPTADRVNLIHAADLADAVVAALHREAWEVFNVAGTEAVSIAELAAACVDVAGGGKVILPADDGINGTSKYQLDFRKAAAAFGYVPRIGLRDGLARTLAEQY